MGMTTYKAALPVMVETLVSYQFKRDIPRDDFRVALRVDFGLYGYRYVLRGTNGLLLRDGGEMPVHIAHLVGVGPVIGPRDIEAARNRPYAQAWRESVISAINERLGLR